MKANTVISIGQPDDPPLTALLFILAVPLTPATPSPPGNRLC